MGFLGILLPQLQEVACLPAYRYMAVTWICEPELHKNACPWPLSAYSG